MIEAGLCAAGVRTGLYTSPHLVEPTERIQIGGVPVGRNDFASAFQRVHETAERMRAKGDLDLHPAFFETVTAMAFLLFREAAVETVVLEVGLGGRLDATNVVTPALSVITPVDFDHQEFIGDTLGQIAGEKAGILKSGIHAVFARQQPEAEQMLESRARELRAPFFRTRDWPVERLEMDALCYRLPLRGSAPSRERADRGVRTPSTWLPDLRHRPDAMAGAPGTHRGAAGDHNPSGARALADYMQRFYTERRVWLVYGVMRDKPVEAMTRLLLPKTHGRCRQRRYANAPRNQRASKSLRA